MKKRLWVYVILFVAAIVLMAFGIFKFLNKDKLSEEVIENRDKVIRNMGGSDNNQVVVKFSTEEYDECYYMFSITDRGYVQYLYIFHDNVDEYNEYVNEYRLSPQYELRSDDKAYLTIIKLSDIVNVEKEDVKSYILEKYTNSAFTIIE